MSTGGRFEFGSAMKCGAALVLLGTVLIGSVAVSYTRELLAVDACVDAGGSFDYSRMTCDRRSHHPFVRYSVRHPAAELIVASGGLIVVGGLALVIWSRKWGRGWRSQ